MWSGCVQSTLKCRSSKCEREGFPLNHKVSDHMPDDQLILWFGHLSLPPTSHICMAGRHLILMHSVHRLITSTFYSEINIHGSVRSHGPVISCFNSPTHIGIFLGILARYLYHFRPINIYLCAILFIPLFLKAS